VKDNKIGQGNQFYVVNNDHLHFCTDKKIAKGAQFNTCEKKIEFHCDANVLLGHSCSLSSGATFTVAPRTKKYGPYLPEPEVRTTMYTINLLNGTVDEEYRTAVLPL